MRPDPWERTRFANLDDLPMCAAAHTSIDVKGTVLGRYWCTREARHGGTVHLAKPFYAGQSPGTMLDSYQWPMERERDESQR